MMVPASPATTSPVWSGPVLTRPVLSGQSWAGQPAGQETPDPNMLLQQIQELQKTVQQLQAGGQGQGAYSAGGAAAYQGAQGWGAPPGTQGYSDYQGWSSRGARAPRPPLPAGPHPTKSFTKEEGGAVEEGVVEGEQTVLLVSNIPANLANPDSLFYAFEKFGVVAKVKILHNKRNTALIQVRLLLLINLHLLLLLLLLLT